MEIVSGKFSIKQIFLHNDNWSRFSDKYKYLIRDDIHFNVEKIFTCKTEALGFHKYICLSCGSSLTVPHTCKSRFCSSCGKIAVDNWVHKSTSKFPELKYQHIIFTLPEQLRSLCLINRKLLLNSLFKLASHSIISWTKEYRNCIPGIISVIHTFGKDIKFNPHIHIIVSSGGLSLDYSSWIPINFFPEKVLKARWKYNVISFLRDSFKNNKLHTHKSINFLSSYPTFNSFLNMLYSRYVWYVHIGRKLDSLSFTIQYIGRYAKRPVLAETRISSFDGQSVSFWFDDKQLQKKVFISLPVEEFIKRIIRHIPDRHFKQIRYFGIFANRVKSRLCNIVNRILKTTFHNSRKILSWAERMFIQNGINPFLCLKCNTPMKLSCIVFPRQIRGAPL